MERETHHEWLEFRTYELKGTYIMLRPNAAGGWFIVDRRQDERTIGQALTLSQAKPLAETILKNRPDLRI